jgi:uncharacterized protein YkwD
VDVLRRLGTNVGCASAALVALLLAAGCATAPPAPLATAAPPAPSATAITPAVYSTSRETPHLEWLPPAAELSSRGGARPELTATVGAKATTPLPQATTTTPATTTSLPPTATLVPPPPNSRPVPATATSLPPPPPSPSPVSSQGFSVVAEQAALALINQERQSRGLAPVAMSEALRQGARAHAEDMAKRNYFSHSTPEGLSPFDRMRRAGISFVTAGENMGFSAGIADPVQAVRAQHQGMMAEQPPNDGHLRAILNPAFGRVGIGVALTPDQRIYYVSDFTN